jgi:hypothetical protein
MAAVWGPLARELGTKGAWAAFAAMAGLVYLIDVVWDWVEANPAGGGSSGAGDLEL